MTARALPFMKLFVDDFLKDPAQVVMTPAECGAYIRLLCHMWRLSMNRPDFVGLPDDDRYLARCAGCRPGQPWLKLRRALFDSLDPVLIIDEVHEVGLRVLNLRLKREHEAAVRVVAMQSSKGRKSAEKRRTDSTAVEPSSNPLKKKKKKEKKKKSTEGSAGAPGYTPEFDSFWATIRKHWPGQPGSKADCFRWTTDLLKAGETYENLTEYARRYLRKRKATGNEACYNLSTFFNSNNTRPWEGFADDDVPADPDDSSSAGSHGYTRQK